MDKQRRSHWEEVYSTKEEPGLSWHQDRPDVSLELAEAIGLDETSAVIDIGGGTSLFVDLLLKMGLTDLAVLDVSGAALERTRKRLGPAAGTVRWITADITEWRPDRRYDLWHDRAVFHFLTEPADRQAYLAALREAIAPGGHAIIATFAPDGPERCSGLPVIRYSPKSLGETLGQDFERLADRAERHVTPWGTPQSFQYSLFRRT